MKLYFTTIFVFLLLLVATISNGTFLLNYITIQVIESYFAVIISFIVILCCIEAIIERTRERITNTIVNILDGNDKTRIRLHNNITRDIDALKEHIIDKIVDLHTSINITNDKTQAVEKLHNEALNVKLNNSLIETHKVHEVLKEVFMLDASIAKDTKLIKETIGIFNKISVDDLRNDYVSTSTSDTTFKDLSKGLEDTTFEKNHVIILEGIREVTNEELSDLYPELLEKVEEPVREILDESGIPIIYSTGKRKERTRKK